MATKLRRATTSDLDGILEIEHSAFSDPWSRASFEDYIDNPNAHVFIAERDGDGVLGYVVLLATPPDADIANLAVAARARRNGIGRRLVGAALDAARVVGVRHVYLEVRESNNTAISLYESAGFRMIGRRRSYYSRPVEDARVLRAEVSGK
jgi:ribosomal-protein-alanine N-acetyltransferase